VPHRIIQYEVGTMAVDGWAVNILKQRGGDWAGPQPAQAHPLQFFAVPNVTAHPSMASVL